MLMLRMPIGVWRWRRQIQTQIAARAGQQGESTSFTPGWCYLSDYFAPAAEAILDALREDFPGVAWVGTIGVGVAASDVRCRDVRPLEAREN